MGYRKFRDLRHKATPEQIAEHRARLGQPATDPDEVWQQTEQGLEIPVPKRETFMDALKKAAPPKKP